MNPVIEVMVVRDITLPNESVVPADTVVILDPTQMVALWQGQHFDLFHDEFCHMN